MTARIVLATDLDGTFLGGGSEDRMALYDWMTQRRASITLIYVTGRSLAAMHDVLHELPLQPDHIIADVGTAVYAGPCRRPVPDIEAWLDACWPPDAAQHIRHIMRAHPELKEQPLFEGRRLSYFYGSEASAHRARQSLEAAGYDVLMSAWRYFDVLPRGVQKGPTLMRLLQAMGLPARRTLVAGDTLNDVSLFQTGLQGVVVANREALLADAVRGLPHVWHSEKAGAAGVLDGLRRMQETR